MNYTKNNWTNDAGSADIDGTNLSHMEQGIYDANTLVKTAAQWVSDNTVLASGQWGKESDSGKMKSGDGVTAWNSLVYINDYIISGTEKIAFRFITGTTSSSEGGATSSLHGLNLSQIINVDVQVYVGNYRYPSCFTAIPGYQFDYYTETTAVAVFNHSTNSELILGVPFLAIITYFK